MTAALANTFAWIETWCQLCPALPKGGSTQFILQAGESCTSSTVSLYKAGMLCFSGVDTHPGSFSSWAACGEDSEQQGAAGILVKVTQFWLCFSQRASPMCTEKVCGLCRLLLLPASIQMSYGAWKGRGKGTPVAFQWSPGQWGQYEFFSQGMDLDTCSLYH